MPELELMEWLKGEDVAPEAELMFVDAGEQTEIPQQGDKPAKKSFEIGVSLPNKEIKKWTMNLTSQRAVAQGYGKNTDMWVGKPVMVFVQDRDVMGTMRKVIFARIPGGQPAAPAVPTLPTVDQI